MSELVACPQERILIFRQVSYFIKSSCDFKHTSKEHQRSAKEKLEKKQCMQKQQNILIVMSTYSDVILNTYMK